MKKILKISVISFIILVGILLDIHSKNNYINVQKNNKAFAVRDISSIKKQSLCIKDINDLKVYVYMFHYVIPEKDVSKKNKIEYGNSLNPEFFEKILKRLKNEVDQNKIYIGDFTSLENFSKYGCFPNKNIVILTADDGWDDSYNYLFPLAKKYNIKFNLGIISSKVSKVDSEINNFANEYEIKSMLSSGIIKVLSHTYSHIDLRKKSDETLKTELCESKENLQNLFDIKINTIIYPSGKYDKNTLKYDKTCGYKYGFTTKSGVIKIQDLTQKPLELPRIRINREINIEKTFSY